MITQKQQIYMTVSVGFFLQMRVYLLEGVVDPPNKSKFFSFMTFWKSKSKKKNLCNTVG